MNCSKDLKVRANKSKILNSYNQEAAVALMEIDGENKIEQRLSFHTVFILIILNSKTLWLIENRRVKVRFQYN